MLQNIGNILHLSIEDDPTIDRGGCVVESAFGEIDIQIEAQFAELEHGFHKKRHISLEADNV